MLGFRFAIIFAVAIFYCSTGFAEADRRSIDAFDVMGCETWSATDRSDNFHISALMKSNQVWIHRLKEYPNGLWKEAAEITSEILPNGLEVYHIRSASLSMDMYFEKFDRNVLQVGNFKFRDNVVHINECSRGIDPRSVY